MMQEPQHDWLFLVLDALGLINDQDEFIYKKEFANQVAIYLAELYGVGLGDVFLVYPDCAYPFSSSLAAKLRDTILFRPDGSQELKPELSQALEKLRAEIFDPPVWFLPHMREVWIALLGQVIVHCMRKKYSKESISFRLMNLKAYLGSTV